MTFFRCRRHVTIPLPAHVMRTRGAAASSGSFCVRHLASARAVHFPAKMPAGRMPRKACIANNHGPAGLTDNSTPVNYLARPPSAPFRIVPANDHTFADILSAINVYDGELSFLSQRFRSTH